MADFVKALVLVVQIAAAWVRVPAVAATKTDIGMAPCREGALMIPKQNVSGRRGHDS